MSSRPLLRPLCDPYDLLLEKSELYLAIVNRWAAREGHERLVQEKVGIGKLAAIVGLAARSLLPDTPTHSLETLQSKSGLSPLRYNTALDHLQAAIDDHHQRQNAPRTPRKDYRSLNSPSYSQSDPCTPKGSAVRSSGGGSSAGGSGRGLSLQEKAKAVQSGAAFGLANGTSPRTPHSHRSKLGLSLPVPSPAQRRLPIGTGRGGEANTSLASPSTFGPATPSRRSLKNPQTGATPGGQSHASTPKSVRFESNAERRRRSTDEDGEMEVDRTPSKRMRFATSTKEAYDAQVLPPLVRSTGNVSVRKASHADSRAASSQRLRRRTGQSIHTDRFRPISDLDDRLPFVLFPLLAMVKRDRQDVEKRSKEAQEVVSRWLDVWKDWLDEEDDRADDDVAAGSD